MSNIFFWRVDESYKDSGVHSKNEGFPQDDKFASQVSIDRSQRWGIANSGGIRKLSSGEKDTKNEKKIPAAIFLISNQNPTGFHNPWDDSIEYATGTIRYWGDAKYKEGKGINDWNGNLLLSKINELILNGKYSDLPPILYFTKDKMGYVTFRGLCALESLETTWFLDKNRRVINYRCNLIILNADKVAPQWLVERAKFSNNDSKCHNVPSVWTDYTKTGRGRRLLSWKKKIRTEHNQLPQPGGPGDLLLKQLFKLNPKEFETLICFLLQSLERIIHRIYQTRYVKDSGFDMEGEFILPEPFKYPIKFKGEVKRQKGAIGAKDVSRLVARLSRGEYGLFFTTSYFTKDAQQEVIIDNYPIKLVSGADLYDFFYEAKLLNEKGLNFDIMKDVLNISL